MTANRDARASQFFDDEGMHLVRRHRGTCSSALVEPRVGSTCLFVLDTTTLGWSGEPGMVRDQVPVDLLADLR